jgi:hypothetical protein
VRIRLAGQQLAVWHDGAAVDASRDLVVNPGHDELVFKRADGREQRLAIEVAAGAFTNVDAPVEEMVRPQPKPLPKLQPKVVVEEPPAPVIQTKPEPRYVEQQRSRTLTRVGIGFIGASVVAAGVAGTFAVLSNRDFDRAKALGCNDAGDCPVGPATDRAQRSNDRAQLAQISAVASGALLAGGAVMWFYGHKTTRREVTLRVEGSSAAIGWRF